MPAAGPPGPAGPAAHVVAELLVANDAFYAAFEAGDLDAMSDLWLHTPDATCTHPGWPTMRGWAAISSSWFAIFQGGPGMQVIQTDVRPTVVGDVGWVSLDENVLSEDQAQTVAAVNIFARVDGRWRLAVHHGSGVVPP